MSCYGIKVNGEWMYFNGEADYLAWRDLEAARRKLAADVALAESDRAVLEEIEYNIREIREATHTHD